MMPTRGNRVYYGDVERNVSLANILKIVAALELPASQVLARTEKLLG